MSRVVVDLASNAILQVEKSPEIGESSPVNGKYLIPIPDGVDFEVTSASYVLPQDGGDIASQFAAGLLAQYPMYTNMVFNFLLESTDIGDLDLTAVGPTGNETRVQTGRSTGPASLGQAPNSTALLPLNSTVAPTRPGLLITDTIDIGPATATAGADAFMVWWQVWEMATTEDVMSDFGGTAGINTPAIKSITEIAQEPAELETFISNDDGTTWVACGRLQPTDLVVFNTSVRLAFRWSGTTKLYIGAYAILF